MVHYKRQLLVTAFLLQPSGTHVTSCPCISVARKCGQPPTQARPSRYRTKEKEKGGAEEQGRSLQPKGRWTVSFFYSQAFIFIISSLPLHFSQFLSHCVRDGITVCAFLLHPSLREMVDGWLFDLRFRTTTGLLLCCGLSLMRLRASEHLTSRRHAIRAESSMGQLKTE